MSRVLVLGASGLVGSTCLARWRDRFDVLAPSHAEVDVLDASRLTDFFGNARPRVVVNFAAWADVDAAEAQAGDEQGSVYRLNAVYPGALAQHCAGLQAHLVHISTDYVFDGTNDQRPYREADPVNPLSWYARTKAIGEQRVLASNPEACVARIEMPFTAMSHPKRDFARTTLQRLERGEIVTGVVDQRITPVYLDDAAEALARILERHVTGTLHIAATTWASPYDFARGLAIRRGLDADQVRPEAFASFSQQRRAPRPRHSWLDVRNAQALLGSDVLRSIDLQLDAWAEALVVASQP
ncbi:MAG: NAD(P)-dependent oxidoreductase [Chloroflexota bacterium]|nr:NAD(P)-dependent oxidoreductase [Chloroflexota bacterium]